MQSYPHQISLFGTPPLSKLTAKFGEPGRRELDEQAALLSTSGILAEDDLALTAIDLADPTGAVGFMPRLHEAEHADVKADGAVDVGHVEDGTRIPFVDLIAHGCASCRESYQQAQAFFLYAK